MQREQSGLFFSRSGGSVNKARSPVTALLAAAPSSRNAVLLFFFLVLAGALLSSRWINNALIVSNSAAATTIAATPKNQNPNVPSSALSQTHHPHKEAPKTSPPRPPELIPFACPAGNNTPACISRPPPSQTAKPLTTPSTSCPSYFRWIHEDLRPWKATGITREMVERARRTANFRLVVLEGRAYIERYRRSFQSRDVFTLWGIVQLLRRYPGQLPDLDLMFDCVDWPVVKASAYRGEGKPAPPPLFRYCADDATLDIVFPDWSFWGWPEINIKPWGALLEELKEGNKRTKWMDREPYAYWKGNPAVATARMELLKCNVSDAKDWNARIYAQDWLGETKRGFKQSDLAGQCAHRYKIYVEGSAWSVSDKYILACDSTALIVRPRYYDFFTRGLMPVHHYWPVRDEDKCGSIKFAVDWGNSHRQKAQAIGKAASEFVQEELRMDDVYDYMFHLLSEYAKLLRYKPAKPRRAVELCAESLACGAEGVGRKFMMESMVNSSRGSGPCAMPPPYSPAELGMLQRRKVNSVKQVELWERRARESKGD